MVDKKAIDDSIRLQCTPQDGELKSVRGRKGIRDSGDKFA